MASRRASQRVETALYTCLRTSCHAPACWVEALRPLLRTPERRLRSVEARRGLSLSPQRARKTSFAFHSSTAASSRHRELGLDGRAVEGLSDAPRSRPLQHQPSGLKARGGGACACIAVSNYVLSAQRALSRIIISYNPCPVNTQRSAHSGVLGCAHRTRAPPPKSKRARGWQLASTSASSEKDCRAGPGKLLAGCGGGGGGGGLGGGGGSQHTATDFPQTCDVYVGLTLRG